MSERIDKDIEPLDKSYLTDLSLHSMFNKYLSLDAPDTECGLHALHVSMIVEILLNNLVKMTDKYNLSEKDIKAISIAASLHDVGKAYVSSRIITNSQDLNKDEYALIKTHPLSGAAILDYAIEIKDNLILKYAKQVCRWHHERWDGNGYPDKLSGEQIPIAAQVVSLADCYDALTSKRSYGRVYTHAEAVVMICSNQCGLLNPLLLQCLIEAGNEIKEAHNEAMSKDLTADEILKLLCNLYKDKIDL